MRIPLRLFLVGTLSVVTTTAANATPDALFWQAVCSSGAKVACASILIRTVQVDANNNYVEVRIRNLQGFDPRDNTGGSVFDSFALNLPNSPYGFLSSDVPKVGWVGLVGIVGQGWLLYDGVQDFGGYVLETEDTLDPPYAPGDGIRGCAPGPQRGPLLGQGMSTVETCASQGFTGWATVDTFSRPDFNGPYKWDTSGASYTLWGATHDGDTFRIDFPADAAIVTPEPASIALLASGLVLVGAATLRRSRKKSSALAAGPLDSRQEQS